MTPAPKPTAQFEHLLEYLRQTRGFDFSGYKRLSLTRRVAKRMQMVNVENFADYIDFLYHRLEEEVQRARQDAETVNEELETTNEELQSTNEELETMNEELQSTNEELQNLNEEHRKHSDELHHSNAFMKSILSSLRSGIIVIDRSCADLEPGSRGSVGPALR
jgi:two-component system, chemotaxis family, CheB/CheR fusion protein